MQIQAPGPHPKAYLDKAFRLNPRCRITALDDEDLMPMWLMLGED
jgi:hypothetical protein